MSESPKYPLYDLSPKEFEELALELLSTTNKYQNLSLSKNMNDYLFADIYGEYVTENKKTVRVAIEVKHWLKFNVTNFKNEVIKRVDQLKDVTYIQFVTSAKIENHQKDKINDIIAPYRSYGMQLYNQDDIVLLLIKNPKIAKKYFQPVFNKKKWQRIQIYSSILVGIISLFLGFESSKSSFFFSDKEKSNLLDVRIERVEKALTNIKDLEKYLGDIKTEMEETSKDVSKIKDEYEQVQKLKKLSNDELAVLNTALQRKSWYEILLNYILGIIFGIVASIIGSVLIERYKKRKQLQ